MNADISIQRKIKAEDANWPGAMANLSSKYRLSSQAALKHVDNFLKRLHRPLNLYWFLSRKLSAADNKLIAALCECYGADNLILVTERPLKVPFLPSEYRHELSVKPSFKRDSEESSAGSCSSALELKVFRFELTIKSALRLIIVQTIIFLFAALFCAAALALLAYSAAVLLLFIFVPGETTIAATQDARVGIAVLGISLVLAAVFGQAVRNLFRKCSAALRRQTS